MVRLFPLRGVILFPHAVPPRHILEPRYRQMTQDALAAKIGSRHLLCPVGLLAYVSWDTALPPSSRALVTAGGPQRRAHDGVDRPDVIRKDQLQQRRGLAPRSGAMHQAQGGLAAGDELGRADATRSPIRLDRYRHGRPPR